jgi:hypothetical protein
MKTGRRRHRHVLTICVSAKYKSEHVLVALQQHFSDKKTNPMKGFADVKTLVLIEEMRMNLHPLHPTFLSGSSIGSILGA